VDGWQLHCLASWSCRRLEPRAKPHRRFTSSRPHPRRAADAARLGAAADVGPRSAIDFEMVTFHTNDSRWPWLLTNVRSGMVRPVHPAHVPPPVSSLRLHQQSTTAWTCLPVATMALVSIRDDGRAWASSGPGARGFGGQAIPARRPGPGRARRMGRSRSATYPLTMGPAFRPGRVRGVFPGGLYFATHRRRTCRSRARNRRPLRSAPQALPVTVSAPTHPGLIHRPAGVIRRTTWFAADLCTGVILLVLIISHTETCRQATEARL